MANNKIEWLWVVLGIGIMFVIMFVGSIFIFPMFDDNIFKINNTEFNGIKCANGMNDERLPYCSMLKICYNDCEVIEGKFITAIRRGNNNICYCSINNETRNIW